MTQAVESQPHPAPLPQAVESQPHPAPLPQADIELGEHEYGTIVHLDVVDLAAPDDEY
ncbi:hypothetical protein [Aeromonas salmonicida]|uniref:hypothetical protein n=1 Tax=Aeromonas salmonicida TaxID=645 RepID=UPI000AA3761F|nr:hypothetical protein [Aeromonas salmonicida]